MVLKVIRDSVLDCKSFVVGSGYFLMSMKLESGCKNYYVRFHKFTVKELYIDI